MIKYEIINPLNKVLTDTSSVLLHVANCQNYMNAGIAKEIRTLIPSAFDADTKFEVSVGEKRLGLISSNIPVLLLNNSPKVINLYAQLNYGKEKRQIHYGHLVRAMYAAKKEIEATESLNKDKGKLIPIIPYKMGCKNAGGNWDTVLELIEGVFHDRLVVICK